MRSGRSRWTMLRLLAVMGLFSVIAGVRITFTPKELKEKQTGDSILVGCRADDVSDDVPADIRAKWTKVDSDTEIPTGGRVYARSGNNRTTANLVIQNAEKGDAGKYRCSFGEDSADIDVSLYESIQFVDTKSEQNPLNGQEATITCRATGDPAPLISWVKNGDNVDGDEYSVSDNGDLTIKVYEKEKHDGDYQCSAFQKDLGSMKSMDIRVFGHVPPGPVTANLVDAEKYAKGVHEDMPARLTCSADGVPKPDLKWSKNGAELSTDDRYDLAEGGVLHIKQMKPDDVGTYTCTATNVVGKNETHIELKIYLKPQINKFDETQSVLFGKDFSANCEYSGGETLSAIVTRSGIEISERTSATAAADEDGTTEASGDLENKNEQFITTGDKTATFNIKSATLEDAGEYQCTVTNDAGQVSKVLKLEVHKAPEVKSQTPGPVRAIVGSQYTLSCDASAVPDPTWTWSKQTEPEKTLSNESGRFEIISEGKNTTLKLTPADGDFVSYICTADNGVEPRDSQEIKVLKIETPETPSAVCDVEAAKPTSITLKMDAYSSQHPENQRPLKVDIVASGMTDSEPKTFSLDFAHDGLYKLTKLAPKTEYLINITGQNEAGNSAMAFVACSTKDPTPPSKPIFLKEGPIPCTVAECIVDWIVEDSGGRDITEYIIEYRPVTREGQPPSDVIIKSTQDSQYVFEKLESATTYTVKVKAVNSVGTSEAAEIELIAPDESRQIGGDSVHASTGPSTGAIVGIVVIIVLIIVVLVDVACYYVNSCGLLMCICVNLCGKTPPEVKAKEVMVEEGTVKGTRFEERQEKTPLKEEHLAVTVEKVEVDASESTPMM